MKAAKDDAIESLPIIDENRPRVVYTHAPVLLGRLVARRDDAWLVSFGGTERELRADPEVDPALLEETLERTGRVLVDTTPSGDGTIVGVVQTQRAVAIGPEGDVLIEARSFRVKADGEVLLSSPHAFLRIQRKNIELYGAEVVTRAREVAKILGRLISLN